MYFICPQIKCAIYNNISHLYNLYSHKNRYKQAKIVKIVLKTDCGGKLVQTHQYTKWCEQLPPTSDVCVCVRVCFTGSMKPWKTALWGSLKRSTHHFRVILSPAQLCGTRPHAFSCTPSSLLASSLQSWATSWSSFPLPTSDNCSRQQTPS